MAELTVENLHLAYGDNPILKGVTMTLNRGEEFIRVRGLIRQEDIRPDNTILSTKLADARITYSGSGELADAARQGWAGRFFNSKWWPF